MKLVGYIKEFKEVIFTIPIYSNGINHYFHSVDDDYKIIGFDEISGNIDHFISLDNNLEVNNVVNIGDTALIVFKGRDNFIIYGHLIDSIPKIRIYFNEFKQNEFIYANQDVEYFESLI